ncbi:MAG: endolytic transglycosylase MltG [Chloroflexi bacterium]|nr:endolytic transglycosylase MltG [Chloroflexota bacterium]
MNTLKHFFQFIFSFLVVGAIVGFLFLVFNLFAPTQDSNRNLLRTNAALPTPAALEDAPLYFYLQQHQSELDAPASNNPTPIAFSILPGEFPAEVAKRLVSQGIIRDAELFLQYIKYIKADAKIQAGEFVLRQTMPLTEIVETLQHGRAKTITFTIRPGWRAEEAAENLNTLGLALFNKDQFLLAVKNGKFDFAFLRARPQNASASLEGYLFPETYNVPFDTPVDTLITVVLNTFNQRVDEQLRAQAAAQKLTLHEIVTLASIVEREAVVASERPIIASVYLNRLKKKMLLQADPTVQYALGYQPATKQWWKTPISLDEYQAVISPYNTYLNLGLPPGPICNPSLAAIQAALAPAQTEYLFFLAKGDGTHVFAKTYEEHQQNLVKYGYSK